MPRRFSRYEDEPEESVYALIPQPAPRVVKEPLYRSIHPGEVTAFKQTAKEHLGGGVGAARTMGKLVSKPQPNQYLPKYSRTAPLPPVSKDRPWNRSERTAHEKKPPIPTRDDRPVMGLVSQKNYITANAVDNILAVPKRPARNDIDYLKKADFGKVPPYLGRVKQQVEDEYRMIEEMQEQQRQDEDKLTMMGEMERAAIVEGLKANWERINKEYQTLSFTLDTPAKKKRKEEYESMLEQIEQDIKRLSKKFVFVHEETQW
eukprot:CAMPEP_0114552792 /NCGR_PEP_ID=MMETSP0114-20121206/7309_1 /TAXON_ID=31324 /ORGANISM="Goniomonas sp, Strain m" /LENGTH=260 /DNA_ID=CAMNT_0001737683 /DNA_START=257 /DNA_END=1039 /DNA_ORIENTATION=+